MEAVNESSPGQESTEDRSVEKETTKDSTKDAPMETDEDVASSTVAPSADTEEPTTASTPTKEPTTKTDDTEKPFVQGTTAPVENVGSNAEKPEQKTTEYSKPLQTESGRKTHETAVTDPEDAKWHTVGIFPGLSTTVTNYIDNRSWSSPSSLELTSDQLPDLSKFQRINLEPGTAYRFRLRAINSCGASDWSEISSFKTCLPGFPGAPSAIKISKSSEGAHLTWEPPPTCQTSNEIVEYSVYLAVKPAKDKEKQPQTTASTQRLPAQLAFVRVYVGAANQCTVSHTSLAAAHVDCSNKPAIIFRIAARNEKGYGPATQVRWLQDPVQSAATAAAAAGSLLSPTRIKSEMGGASPSKRFKTAGAVTRMPPPSQTGD